MIYAGVQFVILLAFLSLSLWHVWGRLAPQWRAQQQQRLALQLLAPRWPRAINQLGLRLLPTVAANCASGCSSCGACESA